MRFPVETRLRPTTPDDLPFLNEMIYEAVHWGDGERPSMDETLARPAIGMLTAGWGRDGDWGLIAESPNGTPIGAAWCRSWTADNAAFGYVADDIPEVSIALARGHREHGLGTQLLTSIIDLARAKGHAKLSLAVEQTNLRAQHVYEKLGFQRTATTAEDYIMVLSL